MSSSLEAIATTEAASQAKPRFVWDDPFRLDQQLTEDERLIQETTRDYAQEQLMPRIREANRLERIDREVCGTQHFAGDRRGLYVQAVESTARQRRVFWRWGGKQWRVS
jgi:hypothetical protein